MDLNFELSDNSNSDIDLTEDNTYFTDKVSNKKIE